MTGAAAEAMDVLTVSDRQVVDDAARNMRWQLSTRF